MLHRVTEKPLKGRRRGYKKTARETESRTETGRQGEALPGRTAARKHTQRFLSAIDSEKGAHALTALNSP